MDEWTNERTNEWMNEWMNERMNEWMNEWMVERNYINDCGAKTSGLVVIWFEYESQVYA